MPLKVYVQPLPYTLICKHRGQLFIRVGYYVSNEYSGTLQYISPAADEEEDIEMEEEEDLEVEEEEMLHLPNTLFASHFII